MGCQSPLAVLVAEENPINQKIILRMLERLGHKRELAPSALDTLSALRRQDYQVAILDAHLFNQAELNLVQQLTQQLQKDSRPWLIIMSSNPNLDQQRLEPLAVDDFLQKPLKFHTLQQALVRVLQGSSITSSSPSTQSLDVLDQQTIQSLQDILEDNFSTVWQDLIEQYLQSAEQLVDQVHTALDQGDAAQLRKVAHTLKSSSAALGAKTFSQICLKIEEASRSGQIQVVYSLLSVFDVEYDKVKAALKQELRE
jgi:CheY-like chemotaxis protein